MAKRIEIRISSRHVAVFLGQTDRARQEFERFFGPPLNGAGTRQLMAELRSNDEFRDNAFVVPTLVGFGRRLLADSD